MKQRVLLTGATGFVGRQVLLALLKTGVDVRLVVRSGSEARLPQSLKISERHCERSEAIQMTDRIASPPSTVRNDDSQEISGSWSKAADIIQTPDLFNESAEWWAAACKGVDTVIHAAWYAEPGVYMQSPKNLDCLAGTLQLAKGCAKAGIKRFVGIGSCAEYDMAAGYLSTDTPLRPSTPYAGAKAAVFLALSTLLPQQGISFAWARLFYLYGEGEDLRRLVPYLRVRLSAGEPVELTSGTQIRDYLDVAQAGRKIAELALGQTTGAVNICSGQAQTVRELAEKIADEYGRRDLLRFGARADNLFDPPCVVGICGFPHQHP